jgi:hypothetical protein
MTHKDQSFLTQILSGVKSQQAWGKLQEIILTKDFFEFKTINGRNNFFRKKIVFKKKYACNYNKIKY